MRILLFNWRDITSPSAGGAEVYLHEVAKRLAAEHEVVLFCGKYKGCDKEDDVDGVRIIRRGGSFSVYLHAIVSYLISLRKGNYEVIVDSINGVPFFTPLFVRKPKIAIIHHLVKKEIFFRELPFPLAVIAWLSEKMIPLLYGKVPVVTVSESSKNDLLDSGIRSEQVHIIHPGVDREALVSGIKYGEPLVAYVGRLKKYKRLEHLLEAFTLVKEAIPEVRLIIAGRGDCSDLQKKIEGGGLEAWVSVRGEISEVEKLDILQKAWVFVSPSMKEGWGCAVVEANACGTPAIAYDVPGLRYSIRHGETGLLVADGNVVELANAIGKVLSNSAFRDKLSEAALKWAWRFSWDSSATMFMEVLQTQQRKAKNGF